MNDSDILVKVENVSKKFCRSLKKSLLYGVSDIVSDLNPFGGKKPAPISVLRPLTSDLRPLPSGLRPDEFWAVNDVSFELKRGECLGLIGRNGAGKTTLLKMLNGLIKPDKGRIEMRGRVGALISLGAGFNPILTGRENIYVNGSVLGLTKKEINEKIEGIIDFADIGDFIDSPVQSYSSGMQVRLGFAVATALEPDVLILDEVLAVGDAAFRNKCYRRIISLRKKASVIFVSHAMEQVGRICDIALLLSKGQSIYLGGLEAGIEAYEKLNDSGEDTEKSFCTFHHPVLEFNARVTPSAIQSGDPTSILIETKLTDHLPDALFRFVVYNSAGAFAAAGEFRFKDHGIPALNGKNEWVIHLKPLLFRRGKYKFGINLIDEHGDIVAWSFKELELTISSAQSNTFADCQLGISSWNSVARQTI
jgi:lipopolysaccharide transport system ATP-binding protein